MEALEAIARFFLRFRYPVSLPEDVAIALGIEISNYISFNEFVDSLKCLECRPKRLQRFMPREEAEEAFFLARRKERFKDNSIYSFYFYEGWVEFVLQFDAESRLRRIYLQHRDIQEDRGIEIPLYSYI